MSESRRGFLLGVAAYVMWGAFPLYWPLLEPAGALEILAHRIVSSPSAARRRSAGSSPTAGSLACWRWPRA